MPLFNDTMSLISGPVQNAQHRPRPIVMGTVQAAFPLTRNQESIWNDQKANPASTSYNLTLEWDLRKCGEKLPLVSDVVKVINTLTARHGILRSVINNISHKPHHIEYVQGSVVPEIQLVQSDDGRIAETVITEMLYRPIALDRTLPVRWVILHDQEEFRAYAIGHHIAIDGLSMSILSKEFLTLLYKPECALRAAVEFNNMHMLERGWATSPAYNSSRDILLSQVQDTYHGPWIKSDYAENSMKSVSQANYREIDVWETLPKSELAEWSKMYKTSWFRVATTFAGLIVADRTRPPLGCEPALSMGFGSRPPAMANCVGQFASALPVKIPLWQVAHEGDGTFRSLVSAVGKNVSDVKKNELFPAVEIAEAIRETGSDYTPPRVAVTYSPKLANAGCRLFPVNGVWDLFFCFLEFEEDVKVGIIYDPTIFSALDVRDMKTLWVRLAAISKASNAMVRDMLEWLPEHTSLPIVPLKSQRNPLRHIHHWFDAHAQTNPDAEALSSGEQDISITYGGLYASTELKAKFLLYNGISAGDRVLVKLERGFQTLEWMLGILKSGAAFIYVDVDSPKNQEDFILENAGPSLVIDEALVEEYSERVMGEPFDCDLATPKYGTSDDDLAYIIYTSGSTGKPKGVMVEHGNIACFVKASTSAYRCGFGTRVLQLASFTFDGSILEWTTALCTGGCLCFAESPKHLVGEYLADVIEKNRVSFMQITPSALGTLPVSRSLSSLRLISVGGEAGSRGIFERWHSRVDIVNAYGPTEAAIAVSFNRINRSDLLPDIISVGRANKGSELYICAENFRPVLGQDSVGEICISGSQVARGYCQLPIQTAKSFSVHEDGNRMYRTGDHGKILSDGSLVVLGRVDREFKVRGYRIRPEEIEGAILSAKVGVSEASVLISEEGTEMIAAVTPDSVSQSRLFASLRSNLINYKVPSRIVKLGRMPKNASGKLDHPAIRQEIRAALARDSHIDGTSNTEVLSDEDDIETRERNREQDVGRIWTRLLHRNSSPASNVNFFDIGGHSLLVPQLHDALKQAFPGKAVRLVDLFHQSTIAQQAVLLGDDPKIGVTKPTYTKRNKKHTHVCRERKDSSDSSSSACSSCFETKIPKLATNSDKEVSEHVAIVGLAGRFPGAMCPDEFYDNLVKGYSGIKSSASSIARETLDGNVWVPQAGVLDNIEDFDHQFWNLTREEATEMDPQQRLFLEMADEALRDAGIDFKVANPDFGSRVGIFVGSANNSYHVYTESVSSDSFLKENRGLVAPSISARTAYQLNFSGPNVTVQTNCASSTVALSLACDALRLGRCEIAVVGGISVQLFEGGYVTQEGQIFSPQGVCRPFDAKADGTVPADAVAAVVLKRYSAAVQDNSSVYARILGTGIGSDGAREKAGYQVPSPRGQAEVIKSAWRTAGISPNRLCYVELHGSGTPVGDALEVEGLTLAMRELNGRPGKSITVGSTKGNIGNTQHASGLVSLIKLCKSMQAGLIPPTRGLDSPNPMINSSSNLALATKMTELKRDDLLAVSASGWGGVNSHFVLAFPHRHLQKTSTGVAPSRQFNRETLQAPRLRRGNGY